MKFAVTQCFKAYILNYAVCTAILVGEHNQVTGLAAGFKRCLSMFFRNLAVFPHLSFAPSKTKMLIGMGFEHTPRQTKL